MKKTQIFENMHLHTFGMSHLNDYLTRTTTLFAGPHSATFEVTLPDGVQWQFDSFNQFLAAYPTSIAASYCRSGGPYEVEIVNILEPPYADCVIAVRAPKLETIENVFEIIQRYRDLSRVVLKPKPPKGAPAPKKFAGATTCHSERDAGFASKEGPKSTAHFASFASFAVNPPKAKS